MYLKYEDIKSVHLEITSRCNAGCPQCPRTANSLLPLSELSISDIQKIFPKDFCFQLKHICICGNYGDAMVSDTTLPAIDYLHSSGVNSISLHTNGSGRNSQWWHNLAKTMIGTHDHVVFAIDGLKDTNHLYRRNTNWELIMQSVSAFINAGGKATWAYLIFEHNQHQVEEARELSEKLGFTKFLPKATGRFAAFNLKVNVNKGSVDIKNSKGEKLYSIKPSSVPEYQNKDLQNLPSVIEKYGGLENYYSTTEISCKYQSKKTVFVSFEAELWPCCYTAYRKYDFYNSQYKEQILQLFEKYGQNFNSLKHHSIKDLINSQWFKEDLEKSWICSSTKTSSERLYVCARHCGKDFDPVGSQFLTTSR